MTTDILDGTYEKLDDSNQTVVQRMPIEDNPRVAQPSSSPERPPRKGV